MNRKTGRTTRMVQHAIDQACAGKRVLIVANDQGHKNSLYSMLEQLIRISNVPKLQRKRGRDILHRRIEFIAFSSLKTFDWSTGYVSGERREVLIDHYALETRLKVVKEYIDIFEQMKYNEVIKWMAQTAKALSALGRSIYLISDDATTRTDLRVLVPYRYASIESGHELNIDWLTLQSIFLSKNLRCQMILDPVMVHRKFHGALLLANRWNA